MIEFDENFLKRYKDLTPIGEGTCGIVYKATDLVNNEVVAIKLLKRAATEDEESVLRFQQECDIATKLKHPNIVSVKGYGINKDIPYIAYEFVNGTNLQKIILKHGAINLSRALKIITSLAKGIGVAHKAGIVHRDLKSENILLAKGGIIKIADFGIARAEGSRIQTETGVILGTPAYMSPEQIQGYKVQPQTDVYALGVIFYELLTGELPFIGSTPMETAMLHLRAEVPPLSVSLEHPLAEKIEEILYYRMLSKDVNDRFENGSEIALALKHVINRKVMSGGLGTSAANTGSGIVKKSFKKEKITKASLTKGTLTSENPGKDHLNQGKENIEQEKKLQGRLNDDNINKKPPREINYLKLLLPVAIFFVFAGFFAGLKFSASENNGVLDYSIRDLKVISFTNKCELEWNTLSSMSGRIKFWEKKNLKSVKFADETKTNQLSHSLLISDLTPGMSYVFQFQKPDGQWTLKKNFKTKEILITKAISQWNKTEQLEIISQTNIPLFLKIVIKAGNNIVFTKKSKRALKNITVTPPLETVQRKLTWSLFCYETKDSRRPLKFKLNIPVDEYDSKVTIELESFLQAIESLKIRQKIQEIKTGNNGKTKALSLWAETESAIQKYKKKLKVQCHHVFEGDNSSTRSQYRLFSALTDAEEIMHYMGASGFKTSHSIWPLFDGAYNQSNVTPNTSRNIKITFDTHYRRFNFYSPGFEPEKKPTSLNEKNLDQCQKIFLILEVSNLSKDVMLAVLLNEYYLFNFYSSELRFEKAKSGKQTFVQHIDPSIFNCNKNIFSFKVLPVGAGEVQEVKIESVMLGILE